MKIKIFYVFYLKQVLTANKVTVKRNAKKFYLRLKLKLMVNLLSLK